MRQTAIALDQIRQAQAAGVPAGIVLGDAGYGDETAFRVGVAELGLSYVLGLRAGTSVWLDYIRRDLMTTGKLKQMIDDDAVVGMTSNPTIFEKAIGGSTDYDETLRRL